MSKCLMDKHRPQPCIHGRVAACCRRLPQLCNASDITKLCSRVASRR